MQVPSEEIVKLLITGTLFIVMLCGFIVLLIKLFDKTRKNFELEKDNLNKDHQTQLLQAQLEIQEQTFDTVSQEIHDNIGQVLSFVKLSINAVDMNDSEGAKSKLSQSKELITKAIQDLRDLSKTLNTSFINDVGLVKSIEQQLSYLKKTGKYNVEFYTSEILYHYLPNVEIVLFRVIQELLNNVVKHAEATSIVVRLAYHPNFLSIQISDNGKGFSLTSPSTQRSGLGLENINSRIRMLGGDITITSEVTKGTLAIIQLPAPV